MMVAVNPPTVDAMDERPLPPNLAAAYQAVVAVAASPAAANSTTPLAASIVIPTYQRRALVLMAVTAALAQDTALPFEVIVVDNASSDGTDHALRLLAARASGRLRYVRLGENLGRSMSRNAGIALANGAVVCFTDSDCCPTPGWLAAGLASLSDPRVGIVQGRTTAYPEQRQPFFSHFIETTKLDGSYSTSNVFYRRACLIALDGFERQTGYWEDADLGWRARRAGWDSRFSADALVYHQVLPLSPLEWLRWPAHFDCGPAIVARYPERRHHLFLRVWIHWFHAVFDLALLSLPLAAFVRPWLLVLAAPYLVAFPIRHGLAGRWPLVKAALHFAWDLSSFVGLVVSSIRHRALVL